MRFLFTRNILLYCLLAVSTSAALADSESPQSLAVKEKNYNFSGYANVVAEAPSDGSAELALDELSFIAAARINQWLNPFSEVELSGATILQEGGSLFSDTSPSVLLERIYNDSHLTSSLSLRIGKMLTPVGEWNLIHAAPLVLTETRPMTTYRGFNEFTSGISLIYTDINNVLPEFQVYAQPDGEIRPKPLTKVVREYKHVTGIHLNWNLDLDEKLGLSLQHAQVNNTGEQQTLAGFNFNRSFDRMSFETEAFHTRISGANPARQRDSEWGAYLLGAYPLDERWSLLGNYEYFADRNYNTASESALLGVNYKSAPTSIWKLEYVKQYGQKLNINTGLFASFSVFF